MTWKPKKQTMELSTVEELWEKYGTWFTGAIAAALAVWLVVMLVGKWQDSRIHKGQAELEGINPESPGASMQLKRLTLEYGGTKMGPSIQVKLAQVMYRTGDYDGARTLLEKLKAEKDVMGVDRAQADLELAYIALEKGDIDEARKRFKVVEDEGLYAFEAKRMIALLDKLQKEPGGLPTPQETPKEIPK